MDTNVEALKGLYVVLGGDVDDVKDITLISDMITEIAKIASTIGIELPAVTSEDNGKVLTVVEGKWAKASIPSQLPAVTSEDAGSVLKVNESGIWAKGTDSVE